MAERCDRPWIRSQKLASIEDVGPDLIDPRQAATPGRRDIVGMVPKDVVGKARYRVGDREPGHAERLAPRSGPMVHRRKPAVANEGELPGLLDDAAPTVGIAVRCSPVHDHLGDRELAFEAPEVALDGGGYVGVEDRRGGALVLAPLAGDLVRERDGEAGDALLQDLARPRLVLGVDVGVQKADGDRPDLLGLYLLDYRVEVLLA